VKKINGDLRPSVKHKKLNVKQSVYKKELNVRKSDGVLRPNV
jgi:hypothetical protein